MQSVEFARLLMEKAKHDQHAMNRLLDDAATADEVIGFHAQQAAEKSIKAVLVHHAIEYRRTHQLDELVALLIDNYILFPPQLTEAIPLTPFAVELRYDMLPVRDDARRPFDRQWAKRCVDHIAEWAASIVEGKQG